MPEYKVLHTFRDKNTKHTYNPGDEYPHVDVSKVSKKRVKELSTDQNAKKKPLIEEIPEEEPVEETPQMEPEPEEVREQE